VGQYTTNLLKGHRVLGRISRLFIAGCLLSATLFAGVVWAATPGAEQQPADVIITNARVYTVDAARPWAQAIAISGDKILAVGSEQEVRSFLGPTTQVVNGRQRLILPGFIDSHIHFMEGSVNLLGIQIDVESNLAEIQRVVKEFAAAHPQSAWIVGRGWSYAAFGKRTLPDRRDLDAVVPDRPVLLTGYDGHTVWANSKALELAGITKSTSNPVNGEIVRDGGGEATGALKESAGDLISKVMPQPTKEERLAALRQGMALANRSGLTRVISCGNDTLGTSDDEYLDLFSQLKESGELTLRFFVSNYQPPDGLSAADLTRIEETRKDHPPQDDWLAGGAVKMFLDGVIESHTAAMLGAYADDPRLSGSLRWTPEHYKAAVAELDKRHIQVFTHAIGDRAVRLALDAYAGAAQQNHTRDVRHRIEHIETVSATDVPRFGSLGVIASFQPLHAYPDNDTIEVWLRNVGPEREPRAWAWQSIWKAGGHEAFGSDWPVVTMNPWEGVQSAVTRQTHERKPAEGFVPAQRLSLAQAIEGYTLGAAYSIHREQKEGSIKAGKLADLIVLDRNLFQIDPHTIAATQVLMTMVGGKIVYESPAWKQPAAEEAGMTEQK